MALMHCPHCGAENFTMEGWEDLDHCTSCGKPLGELERGAVERGAMGGNGQNARSPVSRERDGASRKRP
jgi:predicted RNA-binding Zn-ribbon protein involved in translation (DUF1610 family)